MVATEKLKKDLVTYIASFTPTRERVFTVRDFNSQVMAMTFDAAARDGLAVSLDELVQGRAQSVASGRVEGHRHHLGIEIPHGEHPLARRRERGDIGHEVVLQLLGGNHHEFPSKRESYFMTNAVAAKRESRKYPR